MTHSQTMTRVAEGWMVSLESLQIHKRYPILRVERLTPNDQILVLANYQREMWDHQLFVSIPEPLSTKNAIRAINMKAEFLDLQYRGRGPGNIILFNFARFNVPVFNMHLFNDVPVYQPNVQ
jgi:hypothetical protein